MTKLVYNFIVVQENTEFTILFHALSDTENFKSQFN